ncbi:hypothetical protein PN471_16400 [Aphanizomenon sp. CS-733/32]|uniref:hypothetical protein n=1 Tax=Aphanizomenon sp. CS-733/32 TaxID=3021715 RepID=UPI00233121D3|nr:hypothetical protein [Aphanizomenon sp. CS-733/32]MDB9310185.1 hypothetical protein [Aphanizomenon sp. CS-733/32]
MSNDGRETTFTFKRLSSEFNNLEGYYNLYNDRLASQLKELNLLGGDRTAENKVYDQAKIFIYKKWSFTVSFLQMLNAWQWFFAGILLERNSYLTTQAMQMYYYTIFFSCGSFLSAHFKGNYTLADIKTLKEANIKNQNNEITKKVRNETLRVLELMGQDTESYLSSINDNQNIEEIMESARREVWLVDDETDGNYIYVAKRNKKKGGEHEVRAKWYYDVFNGWESKVKILYPDVRCFNENEDDKKFHSDRRNMFTYSIQMMADELCSLDEDIRLTNEQIICLWQRKSSDLTNRYPEAFWALEHIKVVVDLHTKLLEGYNKDDSPYTEVQEHLLKNLCEHHKRTGLVEVLKVAMPTILEKIGI